MSPAIDDTDAANSLPARSGAERGSAVPPISASLVRIDRHLRRQKGRLAYLIAESDRLARVNRVFNAYLPPHLHDHAQLMAISDDAWIVQTDSSAWATRLRYVLPSLRHQLCQHLKAEVPPLKLRICPGTVTEQPPPRRLSMTSSSASVIQGAAETVNDERLGAALRRLAEHAQKRAG